MNNMTTFKDIRVDINLLVAKTELIAIGDLKNELRAKLTELSELRSAIFGKDKVPEPSPAKPIKVRVPGPAIPSMSGHYRRMASSTCYNPERYVPYKVLWAKVIIRAAYDYALWRDSRDMRLKKFAQDAERWLFESSPADLSFESICFAFDFPIKRIRIRTRALTKQDVKKLEFRERHGRVDPGLIGETIDGDLDE